MDVFLIAVQHVFAQVLRVFILFDQRASVKNTGQLRRHTTWVLVVLTIISLGDGGGVIGDRHPCRLCLVGTNQTWWWCNRWSSSMSSLSHEHYSNSLILNVLYKDMWLIRMTYGNECKQSEYNIVWGKFELFVTMIVYIQNTFHWLTTRKSCLLEWWSINMFIECKQSQPMIRPNACQELICLILMKLSFITGH